MNLGFPEMLFLGLLALLLFGPKRLPEIGRQIGKALGEFKRASSEFQNQLEDEVRQLEVQQESQRTIAPPAPEGSIAQTTAPVPGRNPEADLGASAATSPDPSPPLSASSACGASGGNGAQGA